jgi:hypothetical protein
LLPKDYGSVTFPVTGNILEELSEVTVFYNDVG